MPTADVESAVDVIAFSRLLNQGQCCDGLKRLLVHDDIFDEVVGKLGAAFAAGKIGRWRRNLELRPARLLRRRQLDLLVGQVDDAKAKGAIVVTGGNSLEADLGGAFFEPTVLTQITRDMRVWREEVFGPVLPVVRFSSEDEAIELANDTQFGLGAYVFTSDEAMC